MQGNKCMSEGSKHFQRSRFRGQRATSQVVITGASLVSIILSCPCVNDPLHDTSNPTHYVMGVGAIAQGIL